MLIHYALKGFLPTQRYQNEFNQGGYPFALVAMVTVLRGLFSN